MPDGQQVMLKLSIPASRPVPAAGRPSRGAARRRALRRFQPRGGLPRAGQEPRHDRQLQPRAAVGPSRQTSDEDSTARSATAIDEIYQASTARGAGLTLDEAEFDPPTSRPRRGPSLRGFT